MRSRLATLRVLGLGALGLGVACAAEPIAGPVAPLVPAYCAAVVESRVGPILVDVERDYLPQVVTCEHGAADFEALKAQAIAARSYLYYRLEHGGTIGDDDDDQVYRCSRAPGPRQRRAVLETAGQILRYRGTQVAAFFVAGARQTGPTCRGGRSDPSGTETWVTYNDGRRGDDVAQSTIGSIRRGNHANRGCLSQHGAHCLAGRGHDALAILRFYYGADIELVTARGGCLDAGPPRGGFALDRRILIALAAVGIAAAAILLTRPRRRRRRRRR